MNHKKNIANLIEEQNKFYLKNGIYHILPEEGNINPNPSHINNGFCYKYAYELQKKLSSLDINCEVMEIEHLEIPHAFIKINNLFYDSETPFGVDKYQNLPLFKNLNLNKEDNSIVQKILNKFKF